jgi:CheY-like chemotaxis protein
MRTDAPAVSGLRQLRHDLLNPINVLVGAINALHQTDLNETQRAWVRMIESTAQRLQDLTDRLESYRDADGMDGLERLADLCSIAAARVSKPVDRRRLVDTIERVVGPHHVRPRILLVDDSAELGALVRAYLEGTGWDLDIVESGERAVAQASTEPYDVVLMDIDLPGLDGATAAHAIRAADLARGASPTPIVAMTAFDSLGAPDEAPDAEIDASGPTVTITDSEVAPLVPEFLNNRRAEARMFREALAAGEHQRIQSAAHKLKGTGRGYGFAEMSRIGGDLERAAHENVAAKMSLLIDELDEYLAHVRVVEPPLA